MVLNLEFKNHGIIMRPYYVTEILLRKGYNFFCSWPLSLKTLLYIQYSWVWLDIVPVVFLQNHCPIAFTDHIDLWTFLLLGLFWYLLSIILGFFEDIDRSRFIRLLQSSRDQLDLVRLILILELAISDEIPLPA